jgi:hypothetical protein
MRRDFQKRADERASVAERQVRAAGRSVTDVSDLTKVTKVTKVTK